MITFVSRRISPGIQIDLSTPLVDGLLDLQTVGNRNNASHAQQAFRPRAWRTSLDGADVGEDPLLLVNIQLFRRPRDFFDNRPIRHGYTVPRPFFYSNSCRRHS